MLLLAGHVGLYSKCGMKINNNSIVIFVQPASAVVTVLSEKVEL